jgi:hypothetical protein
MSAILAMRNTHSLFFLLVLVPISYGLDRYNKEEKQVKGFALIVKKPDINDAISQPLARNTRSISASYYQPPLIRPKPPLRGPDGQLSFPTFDGAAEIWFDNSTRLCNA